MSIQITPTQLEIYRKTARDREAQLRMKVDKRLKRAWDIQKYFHAVSRLMDIDPEFDFNLVPIEDASASLAEMISREGKNL